MSGVRQMKILAALDSIIVIQAAWITATNLLGTNAVDYRLFFLSLISVFLMQYSCSKGANKYITLIFPLLISLPFLWLLYDGVWIILNFLPVAVSLLVNFNLEKLPVDYEEYKTRAKQWAIILVITALISLGLEKSIADYLFRLYINFMIITVILLRETRAYYFKVIIEYKQKGKALLNLILKYGLAVASTVVITTDWILDKSISFLFVVNKAADFLIKGFLDLLGFVLDPIIQFTVNALNKLFVKTNLAQNLEELSMSLRTITKNADFTKGGATTTENLIVNTTIKIVILFMAVLFVIDTVEKMKRLKIKNEQYVEEKEKINRESKVNKGYVKALIKKLFRKNNTLKDKILNTYREFEIVTYMKTPSCNYFTCFIKIYII